MSIGKSCLPTFVLGASSLKLLHDFRVPSLCTFHRALQAFDALAILLIHFRLTDRIFSNSILPQALSLLPSSAQLRAQSLLRLDILGSPTNHTN